MPAASRRAVAVVLSGALACGLALGQSNVAPVAQSERGAPEKIDADAVNRIKDEESKRSRVMETLSYLSDVYGPRLTGSPNLKAAEGWAVRRLTEWGLANAHLEAWGPFGRGWSLESFTANMVEPGFAPLIAYPRAWSPSTRGTLRGRVVYLDAKSESDLDKYRGKLRGAIVLFNAPAPVRPHFEPQARRMTDAELLELANAGPTKEDTGGEEGARGAAPSLNYRKWQLVYEEGAAAVLVPGRGDGGTIFVLEAVTRPPAGARAGEVREPWRGDAGAIIPQAVVAAEQYNRMIRLIEKGLAVGVELSIGARFYEDDPMSYNVVAEIPGTDFKDEVVMIGGCIDSRHAATGATDNAAGVAVAMEAVRIIQALRLKPRRTIRIGLWSGEEEGTLGSRAYVAAHFGGLTSGGAAGAPSSRPPRSPLKPEHEKFSAYFNLDYGAGRLRGVYLQGNESVRPIFRAWLAPFPEATTLSAANSGDTDHTPFDDAGLPAFQFMRDDLEYATRTEHSNMDYYDRVVEDDLKQAAEIAAVFIYHAATRDRMLPRKPARR